MDKYIERYVSGGCVFLWREKYTLFLFILVFIICLKKKNVVKALQQPFFQLWKIKKKHQLCVEKQFYNTVVVTIYRNRIQKVLFLSHKINVLFQNYFTKFRFKWDIAFKYYK